MNGGDGKHLVGAVSEAGSGLLRHLGHCGHFDLERLLRVVRLLHISNHLLKKSR